MNPWAGIKGLPRNIWLISTASLINRAGMMVLPFLAIYITKVLEREPTEAGLIIASYGIGSFITAPFAGRLSDKLGELRLMKFSLIGSGIMLLIISQVSDYYLFFILMPIWASINEAFRPASLAFISNESTAKQRKTAFALYRLAINLGMSFGPVIGGILSEIDFTLLFYVDAITCLIAGVFLIFSKWETRKVENEAPVSTAKVTVLDTLLENKAFILVVLLFLPIQLVYMQSHSTLPLFIVNDLSISNAAFGSLIAVNTVLIILIEVPLNSWMSNWKDINALVFGALLTGLGFGMTAIADGYSLLVATIVIWTFGEMIFFPAASSFISELAPPNKRGQFMGYYQMAFGFSFVAAPWIGTAIYEHFGAEILWISCFIFSLLTVTFLLSFRKVFEKPIP